MISEKFDFLVPKAILATLKIRNEKSFGSVLLEYGSQVYRLHVCVRRDFETALDRSYGRFKMRFYVSGPFLEAHNSAVGPHDKEIFSELTIWTICNKKLSWSTHLKRWRTSVKVCWTCPNTRCKKPHKTGDFRTKNKILTFFSENMGKTTYITRNWR